MGGSSAIDPNLPVWAATARNNYYSNPDPATQPFFTGQMTASGDSGPTRFPASWYAWKWGDALFVVLDPYWNSLTTGGQWTMTLGQAQYNWLKDTLAQGTASGIKYKFIFLHNLVGGLPGTTQMRGGIEAAPYYEWGGKNTDGTEGFAANRPSMTKPIHQLLVDNKVTAVFHGHDHAYVKQILDGIVYQEVPQPSVRNTTGGPASGSGYLSGTIVSSSGHLRVTVSPTGVKSEYIRAWAPVGSPDPFPNNIENGTTRINGTPSDIWTCTIASSGLCQ
jgi:hypothetical protein